MTHDDPLNRTQPSWRPEESGTAVPPRLTTPQDPYGYADEGLAEDDRLLDYEPLDSEHVIELREEQLIPHKEMREVGEVLVRTEIDEIPGRIEVEALREEVEVLHEPVGQVVSERRAPWEDGEALVVPVYEEQLVVVKRLVLRENLRIRRVATRERQVFQDSLRKERLVVEDPDQTGMVHERYPQDEYALDRADADQADRSRAHVGPVDRDDPRAREEGGFLENLVRKAFQ